MRGVVPFTRYRNPSKLHNLRYRKQEAKLERPPRPERELGSGREGVCHSLEAFFDLGA